MTKVSIIGGGNVAFHLYKAFTSAEDIEVIQVYNRNLEKLNFVEDASKRTSDPENLAEADLYVYAVKDDAIPVLAEKIKDRKALFVHTSGSMGIESLARYKNHGVFYPLQTFSKEKPVNFQEIPLCIEANSKENLQKIEYIATLLSDNVYEVNSEQRRALHVSAVLVCNFTNHLYTIASDYCKENGLPFKILYPLIKETTDKIQTLSPYDAQTGPALRNDEATIHKHLTMLNEDQQEIYTVLTESIQKLHGKKL